MGKARGEGDGTVKGFGSGDEHLRVDALDYKSRRQLEKPREDCYDSWLGKQHLQLYSEWREPGYLSGPEEK